MCELATTTLRSAGQHGLRAVLALLAALAVAGIVNAQSGSGTVVTNVATAAFTGADDLARSTDSNAVQSIVAAVCGLSITPDGTIASPGHAVTARPGETVALPYLIQSTANLSADFELDALLDPASTHVPASLALHRDLDGDGILDPGDPVVTGLAGLAPGEVVALLLVITLADDASAAGTVYVDVVGRCAGDPASGDAGNVALVDVERDGVGDVRKTAVPAPGSALAAGATVRYEVAFDVLETPLVDVVLSDVLDASLAAPSSLAATVDGVPQAGAVTYDPVSREVRATFDALSAGADVVVLIETAVLADVPAGTTLRNRAELTFGGGAAESNTVEHEIAASCGVDVTPDGSVAFPGQRAASSPGGRAVLAYELSNTGNATSDYLLSATVVAATGTTPALAVVLDLGEGAPERIGPDASTLLGVPRGDSVALLVLVDLPIDAQGTVYVDLGARCAAEPAVRDDGNVAAVEVVARPDLVKDAVPASGSPVYPGAPVRYALTFHAPTDLVDVVVRDPLDARLEAPSFVTSGIVVDSASGASADVRASVDDGVVVWRLDRVPAGMTVRLEIVTAVRADTAVGATVLNRAELRDGDVAVPLASNATVHPVEALAIHLTKASEPDVARAGEHLTYRLVARNASQDLVLPESDLVDDLPAGVRYLDGSSEATLADGAVVPFEPDVDGARLRWRIPALAPGELVEVRFRVQVLELHAAGDALVNRASLSVLDTNGATLSATATSVVTAVTDGVFSPYAVLLGTAYVDVDGDGHYDRSVDVPLAGLRLYLSNGATTVTDDMGRYTFTGLPHGVAVLKLDATTLPPRFLESTPAEAADGLWRLPLFHGTITRQDIPFTPPEAALAVRQELTVTMGPVSLTKRTYQRALGDERVGVSLVVRTSEALRGLVVLDDAPTGSRVADGGALRFEVGDLPAGGEAELRYELVATHDGDAASLVDLPMPVPTIVWDVRP